MMNRYTIYHIPFWITANDEIEESTFATNNQHEGVFQWIRGQWTQHTGTGQFRGNKYQLIAWLNGNNEDVDPQYFPSRQKAEKYLEQKLLTNQ